MDLNYLDIVIGVFIIFLGLKGVINGFIREFLGIVGIVGGVFIASSYATFAGEWISHNLYTFSNPSAISLIGFLVLLIIIWILALLIGQILHNLINAAKLGFFNRILGFLFASFKVFLIFSIIVYALSTIELVRHFTQKYTQNSIFYPSLISVGQKIIKLDVIPKEEGEKMPEGRE